MAKKKRITAEMVKRHARRLPGTEVEDLWWSGWTVKTPSGGYADIYPKEIKKVSGGADIYEIVCGICKEAWGRMVVQGSPGHVMTSMAHGEAQDIPVIPEDRSGLGCLTLLLNLVLIPVGAYVLIFALGISASFLPPTIAIIVALAVTILIVKSVHKSGSESITRKARRKAQPYRNPFPNVHGSDREATRESIERRGLL